MNYTIVTLPDTITYWENKEKYTLMGYAFIGDHGLCMCIAWGENRRDFLEKLILKTLNYDNNN